MQPQYELDTRIKSIPLSAVICRDSHLTSVCRAASIALSIIFPRITASSNEQVCKSSGILTWTSTFLRIDTAFSSIKLRIPSISLFPELTCSLGFIIACSILSRYSNISAFLLSEAILYSCIIWWTISCRSRLIFFCVCVIVSNWLE